jgi:hypothetical protein
MKLAEYKFVFVAAGLIGVLFIASLALTDLIPVPGLEQFSEIYILGPDHLVNNYPLNVITDENSTVYLGIKNVMSSSAYYLYSTKMGIQISSLPNATTGTQSPLPILSQYRICLQKGETFEFPLSFSFSSSFSTNVLLVKSISLNGLTFDVNTVVPWNNENSGYFFYLLFELYVYNSSSNSLKFSGDFVYFWMNMTSTL